MSQAEQQAGNGPLPRQIPYIVATEGCERFSFYGMRNILTPFLISTLLAFIPLMDDRTSEAKHIFHTFVIGVYFFPLLGGWLADRFYGKYNTIFWLSLVYVIGHACLSIFEDNMKGFYFGLFLIALGSGGIKPLISAFVGDQFDQTNKAKSKIVFDAFYWMINFGSFFASLLMPVFLKNYGPSVAFGIPGLLMLTAWLVLWSGRKKYINVPPAAPNEHSFTTVARTALLAKKEGQGRPGLLVAGLGAVGAVLALLMSWKWGFVISACTALVMLLAFGGIGTSMQLERARGKHTDEAVEGVRAVLRILVVFALVTPFWSLFDQKASTWIVQANSMTSPMLSIFGWEFQLLPAQMQAMNPMMVMILIPLNNILIFPILRAVGIQPTPLRRMGAGIGLSGVAWLIIGWIQLSMDGGTPMSLLWQLLPYIVLTMGEVLVSATGLEFAYSQAPASMKGSITSFWQLAVTVGNLWVLVVNSSVKNDAVLGHISGTGLSTIAFQMFFFAGFALVTALVFAWYATRYKMVDNYRVAPDFSCYGPIPSKA
jgi:POT family proton-dependent oligopeptide transporter